MKKSFNKKPKIIPKELSYESFLHSLKMDNLNEETGLITEFMKCLPVKDRAECIMSFIEKTPYTSFSIIVTRMRKAINRYYEFGSKQELRTYLDSCPDDSSANTILRSLVLARESLISDLIEDNPEYAVHAATEVVYGISYHLNDIDPDVEVPEEVYDKNMREFLIHAAPFKWEVAKGLKILFGEKRG